MRKIILTSIISAVIVAAGGVWLWPAGRSSRRAAPIPYEVVPRVEHRAVIIRAVNASGFIPGDFVRVERVNSAQPTTLIEQAEVLSFDHHTPDTVALAVTSAEVLTLTDAETAGARFQLERVGAPQPPMSAH